MQFLLERLATSTQPPQAFDLETAVAAQIQRIVSARVLETPDGMMSLLEFGMPNVVELAQNSKGQLERYAARLARLIAHYEPRLLHPSVTVEQGPSPLMPYRLAVSGTLQPDGDVQTFFFELPEH